MRFRSRPRSTAASSQRLLPDIHYASNPPATQPSQKTSQAPEYSILIGRLTPPRLPIRTPAVPTFFPSEASNDELTMGYQLESLATCVAVLAYVTLRRQRGLSAIKDVPGPVNPSWIFGMQLISLWVDGIERETLSGHQWYFQAGEAGAADKRFLEDFGNIVRWNGPFGVRITFYQTRQRSAFRILN